MLSQILKPEYGEEHIFIQLQCEVPRVSLCTKFKWTFLEIASLLILYPKILMRFSLIFISIEISFTTKIITMGAWYFVSILLRGVSFPENLRCSCGRHLKSWFAVLHLQVFMLIFCTHTPFHKVVKPYSSFTFWIIYICGIWDDLFVANHVTN